MKPWQAILLTLLFVIASGVTFHALTADPGALLFAHLVHLAVLLGTCYWMAVDSSKIELRKYKSGVNYSPPILFMLSSLAWAIAFPWYLSVRYRIQNGTQPLAA